MGRMEWKQFSLFSNTIKLMYNIGNDRQQVSFPMSLDWVIKNFNESTILLLKRVYPFLFT